MSAQLKAAYDDLVTYLGKDAKGKEKAKRLKDAANELRKKLAAAEERLEQVEAVKDAARERADKAEVEKAEAETRQAAVAVILQRAEQELAQLKQRIVARKQADKTQLAKMQVVFNTTVPAVEIAVMESVLRRLKDRMPTCVSAVCAFELPGGPFRSYDRNTLATGWSDEDLWCIGAVVSFLSAHYGGIGIAHGKRQLMQGAASMQPGAELPRELAFATDFIRWADTNDGYRRCDMDEIMDRILVR